MVPNTGIKASSPRDETHPQNMTATCFLSSQQIKCGTCFLYKYNIIKFLKVLFTRQQPRPETSWTKLVGKAKKNSFL